MWLAVLFDFYSSSRYARHRETNFDKIFRDILNYPVNVDLNSVAKHVNDTTSADEVCRLELPGPKARLCYVFVFLGSITRIMRRWSIVLAVHVASDHLAHDAVFFLYLSLAGPSVPWGQKNFFIGAPNRLSAALRTTIFTAVTLLRCWYRISITGRYTTTAFSRTWLVFIQVALGATKLLELLSSHFI
jgi:hypothetical protein